MSEVSEIVLRRRAKQRERYWADPEKSREKRREKYRRNPESAKESVRKSRAKNREHVLEQARSYYWKDPEKFKARARAYHWKNREKNLLYMRDRVLREKYGISVADFNAILESQGGCCAICGNKTPNRKDANQSLGFAVDHDHKTGAVRGILCSTCNSGIGHLKDDPELLRKAIEYLERQERSYQSGEC